MLFFPEPEQIRHALERGLAAGLAAQPKGYWSARLGATELSFRIDADGNLYTTICLDEEAIERLPPDAPAERTYRFRVVLERLA